MTTMSKPGICCDNCFGLIARRSTSAARLWLDLCDLQMNSQMFGLRTQDFPTLRLLETLGFILTTEIPGIIMVKVQGRHDDPLGTYFCGGKCGE